MNKFIRKWVCQAIIYDPKVAPHASKTDDVGTLKDGHTKSFWLMRGIKFDKPLICAIIIIHANACHLIESYSRTVFQSIRQI